MAQMVENLLAMKKIWVQSLSQEDPLKKGMATYSSVLAWTIPWTEEPDRLQFMGSHKELDMTEQLSAHLLYPFTCFCERYQSDTLRLVLMT